MDSRVQVFEDQQIERSANRKISQYFLTPPGFPQPLAARSIWVSTQPHVFLVKTPSYNFSESCREGGKWTNFVVFEVELDEDF